MKAKDLLKLGFQQGPSIGVALKVVPDAITSLGKKVVTEGRSIKTNLEIAQKTGLLKVKKETIITAADTCASGKRLM